MQRPLQAFLICLSFLSFPAQIQLHHTALHFILHPYNPPFLEASDDRQDEWAPLASCIRKQSGPMSQDAGSYMTPFIKHPTLVYLRLFLNLCLISISFEVHQTSWWLSLAHILFMASKWISFINASWWFLWGFWTKNHLILYCNVWKYVGQSNIQKRYWT